jgi:hypothetical protein
MVSSAAKAGLGLAQNVTIPPKANASIEARRMFWPKKAKVPLIEFLLKAVCGPT